MAAAGAAAEAAAIAAVAAGDKQESMRSFEMRPTFVRLSTITCLCLSAAAVAAGQSSVTPTRRTATRVDRARAQTVKTFDTAAHAADALIDAADRFDVGALVTLFGRGYEDVVLSGEYAQDRQRAKQFVAAAREKKTVSIDPVSKTRAFLLVGQDDWPFPVPIVKRGDLWAFDADAGRGEVRNRRIGSNELDAMAICRGYVEAQHAYALQPREGYDVNQYAQRVISTPGTQDGLAWQNDDGTWEGPVGEKVARAIEQGYAAGEPYHGYFFKVLTRQGPAAPLGEIDYVIKGAMIGGFALVAAPAEYGVTGLKTFIVSHDGVVFQRDFGPRTLDAFSAMERFNPDRSWTRVADQAEAARR